MKHTDRHIITRHNNRHVNWLLLSLLFVCLTACSGSEGDDFPGNTETPVNIASTQLYIYIYAPQTAVPTRADYVENVNPTGNEAKVYSLQIWVFTHDSNKLIAYFSPSESSALNMPGGYEVLQLTIDEEYAQTAEATREHVDVYVLANVVAGNCHLKLDQATTRAELEAAVLAHGTCPGRALCCSSPIRENWLKARENTR